MILASTDIELAKESNYLIDRCMSTRDDRDRLYQFREKYYLFGTAGYEQAKYNRIESHLDLVSSFLYAPDQAFYSISSAQNESDDEVEKAQALQTEFNDDFQDSGISDAFMDAIPYSLVYDTMLTKDGWNRQTDEWFTELVPPHNFGVYREDKKNIEDQPCFCHSYFIDHQEAVGRLLRAGRASDISRLGVIHRASISQFPEMLQRMIIAGTGGTNLTGTIFGNVNPDYSPVTTYQANTEVPLVRFNELWVWDDASSDWRIIHTLHPDIFLSDSKKYMAAYTKAENVVKLFGKDEDKIKPSDTNYFWPGEQPFSKIQPFGKYNYFWGKAHIDSLIPLQNWMLERLDQISDILERQADPAKAFSGATGLTEEKAAAWGAAGTFAFDQLPGFKAETFSPDMPPDIFAEFKEITSMFLEASGLTDLLSGRGEQGVRAGKHAKELKQTGSGRIKKAAISLQSGLVHIGDLGLKLKQAHDDTRIRLQKKENEQETRSFLASEVRDVKMRIRGHAFSPLFTDETKEFAVAARKLGAIDNEMFVYLMNPPERDNIIHMIRKRQREQRMAARMGMQPQQQRGKGHKAA